MKKMMRRIGQAILGVSAAALLLAAAMPANASNSEEMTEEVRAFAQMYRVSEDEIIAEGVRIGGVDIGGLTLMEAVDVLAARQREMLNSTVNLNLEGATVSYTMEQLGLTFINPSEEVVRAASLGKSGSLIERYKATKDIAYNGYELQMVQYAERDVAEAVIAQFAKAVNQAPIEATVTRAGNGFEVTHEQTGIAVDEAATLTKVMNAIEIWDGTAELTLSAEAVITEPVHTYEALSTISDCLGSFKTICGDLDTNRGINVMVGAEKIDGAVILPGESYSVVDVLAPFNADNGYVTAVQYLNGRYDDSLGGGVCSLSTTLYNAVLYAELQVEKRWNHSMVVSYTDWGFDSTINDYGSRDLVFTNNYDTPIYIEAYTVYGKPDSWLYFNIYGKETRDTANRKLKFYNNILECVYPTDEERTYIVDETLAPGTQVWDQGDYPYVVVEAYKEVWVNGVLKSKELLHTDTYVKSAAIIRYNPNTETEPEPAPEPEAPAPETEAPAAETDAPAAEAGAEAGNGTQTEASTANAGSEG
ncbi:MAG: VanW family protein [Lachnospiraceae bacterium]|nr:VanW family protein [Lachnospiraceae bacterium]